jgi:predicted lipid-binding transport protein (Tim44 family)
MQITSSQIKAAKPLKKTFAAPRPQAEPTDNFTFSEQSGMRRLGKGVGGGIAGTLFSGLLLSLPFSLAPSLGLDVQTALNTYRATVLTLGVAGGLASAAMPPGKDWY